MNPISPIRPIRPMEQMNALCEESLPSRIGLQCKYNFVICTLDAYLRESGPAVTSPKLELLPTL